MQFKHGPIEIAVIVLVIAAGSQWLSFHQSKTPPVTSASPSMAAKSPVDDYLVNNLHLGMTKSELRNHQDSPVQMRLDAQERLCWVKGDNFCRLKPGSESIRASDILLQRGTNRSLVLKYFGSPIAYNDNDSKWGYWTKGLPNREMGILFEFRGDQIESIEMATKWSDLAAHLATPVNERLRVPEPVAPTPYIQNVYNPPPQPSPAGPPGVQTPPVIE
jgi:hypothetical protein